MPVISTEYLNRIAMTVMECMHCGILYAMSASYNQRRLEDGGSFYCPKGCKSHFGEGEVAKLQRELEQEKNSTRFFQKESDHLRKSRDALKGVVTKTKKRILAGVCPCCNRTFQNVARHMSNKHPDYAEKS